MSVARSPNIPSAQERRGSRIRTRDVGAPDASNEPSEACASGGASVRVAAPSSSPTPVPTPDPVPAVLAEAGARLERGLVAADEGHLDRARAELDGAVDVLLTYPGGALAEPRVAEAYRRAPDTIHKDKVSCQGCHSSGQYRQCYSCHSVHGSKAQPGFILGLNPRDRKTLTTLRVIPTIRNTFEPEGIKMENFDALPNYWDTPAHNIRKRTDRTRNCDVCHVDRKNFLTKEMLIKDGSKANEGLIIVPRPINR